MKRTRCTARIEHGRKKTKVHGVTADCTRVRIYNETGELLTTRWVCAPCRERMRLPERDVDFRPGQTEVGDEIEYRDDEQVDVTNTLLRAAKAGEAHVDDLADIVTDPKRAEEFRLP